MPRPRPPYLSHERNRHGTAVWYARIGGKRIRIRETYGTPEFDAAYQAAVERARKKPDATERGWVGSLQWLIDQYRDTAAWQRDLSTATCRQRDNIFRGVIAAAGNQPYARITKADIERGRERRAATPHQARHFLDAMRGLFRWAYKAHTSSTIQPLASKAQCVQRMVVSVRGTRKTFPPTSNDGHLVHGNASGLTCCSTLV